VTSSARIDAEATEIEQPCAAYEMSSTALAVGDVDAQGHLVTAGGVDVVHLGVERLAQAGATGAWSGRG
jgi:hypothetical protein